MAKGLSKAQENAIGYLHRNGEKSFKMFYEGSDVKPYWKLAEMGLVTTRRENKSVMRGYDVFTLTPLGERKANELFSTSEASEPAPTPTAAPVAVEPVSIVDELREIRQEMEELNYLERASEPAPVAVDGTPHTEADTVQDSAGEVARAETIKAEMGLPYQTTDLLAFATAYNPDPQPPSPATKTARFKLPVAAPVVTGHNRGKKRTQSQKSATVKRFKAHKVSTIMMERKTPKNANKAQQGLTQGLIRQQYAVAQNEYRRQREIVRRNKAKYGKRQITIVVSNVGIAIHRDAHMPMGERKKPEYKPLAYLESYRASLLTSGYVLLDGSPSSLTFQYEGRIH